MRCVSIIYINNLYRLDFHFIPSSHFPQRGKQEMSDTYNNPFKYKSIKDCVSNLLEMIRSLFNCLIQIDYAMYSTVALFGKFQSLSTKPFHSASVPPNLIVTTDL